MCGDGLDLLEGLGADYGVREPRKRIDFGIDVLGAIAGVGVIGEELCGTTAGFGLDDFEELRETARVVVGFFEDIDAEEVGLLLIGTGHAEEVQALTDAEAGLRDLAGGSVAQQDSSSDLSEAVEDGFVALLGDVAGGVAHDHVREFVGHDPGELGFRFGRLDGSQIDEDAAAGEREGVDVRAGDHMEVEGPLPLDSGQHRGAADEAVAKLLDVATDGIVVGEYGHLLVDLERDLVALRDLLFFRKGIVVAGDRLKASEGRRGGGEKERTGEQGTE